MQVKNYTGRQTERKTETYTQSDREKSIQVDSYTGKMAGQYSPNTLSVEKRLTGGWEDTWHSYTPSSRTWT